MAKNTPSVVSMRQADMDSLAAQYNEASKVTAAFISKVVEAAKAKWDADPKNCKGCDNTGSILIWSTLDGASYDEHGTCPDCKGMNRDMPYRPGTTGPYRSNGMHVAYINETFRQVATEEEKTQDDANAIKATELRRKLEAFNVRPGKGDLAMTYKGRKVPAGLYGIILVVKEGVYGPQALLELAAPLNGECKVWVAMDNLCMAYGMSGDEIGDLKVRHEVNAQAYREAMAAKEKAALTGIELKPLRGTPKQIEWANKLRTKALVNGMDKQLATTYTDAKWWIDNRYTPLHLLRVQWKFGLNTSKK